MANINSRLLERSDNIILMVVKNKQTKKKTLKAMFQEHFIFFAKYLERNQAYPTVCVF